MKELLRELYARFGLAYYESECLHRQLCIVRACAEIASRMPVARPRVDELFASAFSMTLGDVAVKVKHLLSSELNADVEGAVDTRNMLAHRFWFERVHLMFSAEDVRNLISELDGHVEFFQRLATRVAEFSEPMIRRLGVTDAILEAERAKLVAGEDDDECPGRKVADELKRRLKKPQRLIRIWEASVTDGGTALVFELADGTLWQLSDAGLGWTIFRQLDPSWKEHPVTKAHLPANIVMRPEASRPWDYEITLANGAVLWVKPAHAAYTFRWGVRA